MCHAHVDALFFCQFCGDLFLIYKNRGRFAPIFYFLALRLLRYFLLSFFLQSSRILAKVALALSCPPQPGHFPEKEISPRALNFVAAASATKLSSHSGQVKRYGCQRTLTYCLLEPIGSLHHTLSPINKKCPFLPERSIVFVSHQSL